MHLKMSSAKVAAILSMPIMIGWNNGHTLLPPYPQNTALGPVSLRLMTSQFKDIATHTQKYKAVKCTFCGVWVQNFVWNFKGALWNFTQNFEPIHSKICILRGGKNLTTYDILRVMTSQVLVRQAPGMLHWCHTSLTASQITGTKTVCCTGCKD